jgi:hypothetical protein
MKLMGLVYMIPLAFAFQQPASAPANVQRLMAESNLVFQGTVTRVNATTEPEMPASASTVAIVVERILKGENLVSEVVGREITLQLVRPRSVTKGQALLVFSNLAVAGKTIAVKEVAHYDAKSSAAMISQVSDSVRAKPEADLQSSVARADLIVTGTVASITPRQAPGPVGSEHDPQWTQAVVDVQSTEKGSAQTRVTVWFAASTDIRWFRSPKLQQGQAGVFLMARSRERGLDGYTIQGPLDFQLLAQREHIRQLLARGR